MLQVETGVVGDAAAPERGRITTQETRIAWDGEVSYRLEKR